jgi:hypothetical protein
MTITEFKTFWKYKEEYFQVSQMGIHYFVKKYPKTLVYSHKEIMRLTEQDLEGHYCDYLLGLAFT